MATDTTTENNLVANALSYLNDTGSLSSPEQTRAHHTQNIELIEETTKNLTDEYPENEAFYAHAKTKAADWKRERAEGSRNKKDITNEIVAYACEMIRRKHGIDSIRDTQNMGALSMIEGDAIDMKTGEGKTFVGAITANVLAALYGGRSFIITPTAELAKRDREEMRSVFEGLGFKVGLSVDSIRDPALKREAYSADIIYAQLSALSHDHSRDQMNIGRIDPQTQQFAKPVLGDVSNDSLIIDELDQVIIDGGNTPLSIGLEQSEADKKKFETVIKPKYRMANQIILDLKNMIDEDNPKEDFFTIDPKMNSANLTPKARQLASEKFSVLYKKQFGTDPTRTEILDFNFSYLQNAAFVHFTWTKYDPSQKKSGEQSFENTYTIIPEPYGDPQSQTWINKIVLIDENTGRPMKGSRFQNGLHQALEAREEVESEHVQIQPESPDSEKITPKRFALKFRHICGMSGSLKPVAKEIHEVYGMRTKMVPPFKEKRVVGFNKNGDPDSEIYMTLDEKYERIVQKIKESLQKGQPCVIAFDKDSQMAACIEYLNKHGYMKELSELQRSLNLPCRIYQLDGTTPEIAEKKIIADAGKRGMITFATNVIGRGIDIKLGGDADFEFKEFLASALLENSPDFDKESFEKLPQQEKMNAYFQALEAADEIAENNTKKYQEIRTKNKDLYDKIKAHCDAERDIINTQEMGGLHMIVGECIPLLRSLIQILGRVARNGQWGTISVIISLQDAFSRAMKLEGYIGMIRAMGLEKGEPIIHPWVASRFLKKQQEMENLTKETRFNLNQREDKNAEHEEKFFDLCKRFADASHPQYIENLQRYLLENMRHQISQTIIEQVPSSRTYLSAEDPESINIIDELNQITGLSIHAGMIFGKENHALNSTELNEKLSELYMQEWAKRYKLVQGTPLADMKQREALCMALHEMRRDHTKALENDINNQATNLFKEAEARFFKRSLSAASTAQHTLLESVFDMNDMEPEMESVPEPETFAKEDKPGAPEQPELSM